MTAPVPEDGPGSDLQAKTESGVFWVALESLGYRVANLLAFVVVSRIVTPTELGLAAIVNVLVGTFGSFFEQGRGALIVQKGITDRRYLSSTFWQCAGTGALLTVLGILAAPAVADLFGDQHLVPLVRLGSFVFLLHSFEVVPTAMSVSSFQFRALALRKSIAVGVGAVVGVTLAIAGAGAYALVLQLLTYALVSSVMLAVQVGFRPALVWDRALMRRDRSTTYALTGVNLVTAAQLNIDKYLVGILLSPAALAYYTVGTRALAVMDDLTTSAVQGVALPTFAHLQDRVRAARALVRMTRVLMATAAPAFLVLGAVASPFTSVVFGPQFGPSVPVLQVLAIGSAVRMLTLLHTGALVAAYRQRTVLLLLVATLVVTAVLIPLVGSRGLVWIAAAVSLREVVMAGPRLLYLCRVVRTSVATVCLEALRAFAPGAAGGAAAYALVTTLTYHTGVPGVVVLLAGLVVGAGVSLVLLRPLSVETWDEVVGLAGRFTGRLRRTTPLTPVEAREQVALAEATASPEGTSLSPVTYL